MATNFEKDFAALRNIPEVVGNLLIETDRQITEIGLSPVWAPEEKGRRADAVVQATLNRLDNLRAAAEVSASSIEKAAKQALGSPEQGDTQEQILNELRAQRLWSRIKQSLDSVGSVAAMARTVEALIDDYGKAGDSFALGVLREELMLYLRGRNMGLPQVNTWLDAAEVGLLSQEQRQARKALQELQAGLPRVLAAIQEGRRAVLGKSFRIAALPGWNETLRIEW
jgi:hypothetical protein